MHKDMQVPSHTNQVTDGRKQQSLQDHFSEDLAQKDKKSEQSLPEIPCSNSVVLYKTCEVNIQHTSTGGKYCVVY